MAMAGSPDAAHGGYMLDGLLEKGYRVLVNAGDDAHFPEAVLDALKATRYYSTRRRGRRRSSCSWKGIGSTCRPAKRMRSR